MVEDDLPETISTLWDDLVSVDLEEVWKLALERRRSCLKKGMVGDDDPRWGEGEKEEKEREGPSRSTWQVLPWQVRYVRQKQAQSAVVEVAGTGQLDRLRRLRMAHPAR
jgi:hypothetical protein